MFVNNAALIISGTACIVLPLMPSYTGHVAYAVTFGLAIGECSLFIIYLCSFLHWKPMELSSEVHERIGWLLMDMKHSDSLKRLDGISGWLPTQTSTSVGVLNATYLPNLFNSTVTG